MKAQAGQPATDLVAEAPILPISYFQVLEAEALKQIELQATSTSACSPQATSHRRCSFDDPEAQDEAHCDAEQEWDAQMVHAYFCDEGEAHD